MPGPTASELPRTAPYQAVVAAPFGRIGVRTQGGAVVGIEYLHCDGILIAPADPLARLACEQIDAYLADPSCGFDLPYALTGSAFQRAVWRAIAAIPSGQTSSYGALAAALGSSARAVGRACGDNPVPLIVPCHRVVAAGARLGGFMHSRADAPLAIKRWLLEHEGRGR